MDNKCQKKIEKSYCFLRKIRQSKTTFNARVIYFTVVAREKMTKLYEIFSLVEYEYMTAFKSNFRLCYNIFRWLFCRLVTL